MLVAIDPQDNVAARGPWRLDASLGLRKRPGTASKENTWLGVPFCSTQDAFARLGRSARARDCPLAGDVLPRETMTVCASSVRPASTSRHASPRPMRTVLSWWRTEAALGRLCASMVGSFRETKRVRLRSPLSGLLIHEIGVVKERCGSVVAPFGESLRGWEYAGTEAAVQCQFLGPVGWAPPWITHCRQTAVSIQRTGVKSSDYLLPRPAPAWPSCNAWADPARRRGCGPGPDLALGPPQ